jgi:hypothetical protein
MSHHVSLSEPSLFRSRLPRAAHVQDALPSALRVFDRWRNVVVSMIAFCTLLAVVFIAGEARAQNLVPLEPIDLKLQTLADLTFPTGDPDRATIRVLHKQSDGKVLIGGYFNRTVDTPAATRASFSALLRLSVDGTIDTSFNVAFTRAEGRFAATIQSVKAVAGDGIYVAGDFDEVAPTAGAAYTVRNGIVKLDFDGKLVTSWNAGDFADTTRMNAIEVDDQWVYLGGDYRPPGGTATTPKYLFRFSRTNGAIDPGWTPDPDQAVRSLLSLNSAKLIVGGAFTNIAGAAKPALAVLSTAGAASADPFTLSNSINSTRADSLTLSADKTMLYAGGVDLYASSSAPPTRNGIAKFLLTDSGGVSGTQVDAWFPGPVSNVNSLALQGSELYLATTSGSGDGGVVRVDPANNGATDLNWKINYDGNGRPCAQFAVLPLGSSVFVGGDCTFVGPTATEQVRNGFAVFQESATTTPKLSITPSDRLVDFGSQAIGVETTKNITFAHGGDAGSGAVKLVAPLSLVGGNAATGVFDFSDPANDPNRCFPLAEGVTCTVTLKFKPSVAGEVNITLVANTTANRVPASITLKGTGAAAVNAEIVVTPSTHNFGDVVVNAAGTQEFVIKNNGAAGAAAINLTGYALSTTTEFAIQTIPVADGGCENPQILAAQASCKIRVTLTPASSGAKASTFSITNDAPNAVAGKTDVALTGNGVTTPTPGKIEITPVTTNAAPFSFGTKTIGTETIKLLVIANIGGAPIRISSKTYVSTSPTAMASRVRSSSEDPPGCGSTLPFVLAPGEKCASEVFFRPQVVGDVSAEVYVYHNASNPDAGSNPPSSRSFFTGTGANAPDAPILEVTPGSKNFGEVTIGQNQTQTFTIKNVGNAALDISSFVVVTGTGFNLEFPASGGCGGTQMLAPQASCNVEVMFNPATAGAKTGSLDITSNATPAVANVALSGTAVTPQSGIPTLSASEFVFGNVVINTPSMKTVTLTNTGTVELILTLPTIVGTNAADFKSNTTCTTSLLPSASCDYTVTFTPSALGERIASFEFDASDRKALVQARMTGVGVPEAAQAGAVQVPALPPWALVLLATAFAALGGFSRRLAALRD